jgi:glycerol-3-phosphate acyltransferase PlsX
MSATIAVDAMGGDHAPEAIVRGALNAARTLPDVHILLTGDQEKIEHVAGARPGSASFPSNVTIEHTSECIGMEDPPSAVFRRKRNCSLAVAARLVSEGKAQAFFSAGNSGACMASAIHHLRTIEGVDRPAIATILPSGPGHMLLLDAGANVDCHEHNLIEFALMGSAYAKHVMGKPDPTVALVSNGEEEGKGNALTKSVGSILKLMPINFIGNIEGNALYTGKADVVVCDGFVGNIILKTSEGAAEYIQKIIRREITRTPWSKLVALTLKPGFRRARQVGDYAEVGGAPLLGVRGGAVVGHGRSNERAVCNGIRMAVQGVSHDLVHEIEKLIKEGSAVTSRKITAL